MKLKRFILHEQHFVNMFIVGEVRFRVVDGLPLGTKFVRWFQQNGRLEVVVESDEFPDLADGDEIPLVYPLFDKL